MCEFFDPYTSRSSIVVCLAAIKNKHDRENYNRGYEGQIEGSYLGEKLLRARGPTQSSDQIHSQVRMVEAPKKTQK